MRVCVLHPVSGAFLGRDGWEKEENEALCFESSRDAIQHCEQHVFDVSEVRFQYGEFSSPIQSLVSLRTRVFVAPREVSQAY